MSILNTLKLNSNPKIQINFDGGELSSDSGLFLLKEFISAIGLENILNTTFKTVNFEKLRRHSDVENLLQSLYQIVAGYFEDDRADDLRNEPVITACIGKESLASQPTISRFWNSLNEDNLRQFNEILSQLREKAYKATGYPNMVLFDLDTTLLNAYGKQEGSAWNFHYQEEGYHPQLCYDGLTGDLIRAELKDGTSYCSKDIAAFMEPVFEEYSCKYRFANLFVRGDSGFAAPELYAQCEKYGAEYAIRLKANSALYEKASSIDEELYKLTKEDSISHAEVYGEFMYQAGSWDKPRRVACKIEKPYGILEHRFTFIVTNMNGAPEFVVGFYCKRGNMENFIKESKIDFDFSAVSSSKKITNANRLQVHVLAYNLINWMRRMAFPPSLQKWRMETIRLRLVKIASRVVRHGRNIIYKLCSSCPFQEEFKKCLGNLDYLKYVLE